MKRKRSGPNRYLKVQLFCGASAGIIAIAALFGWAADIAFLKSVGTGFVSMHPLVGLNFVFFGFWLFFHNKLVFRRFNYLSKFLLLSNTFLILLKIVDLFYPPLFIFDNLLFPHSWGVHVIPPASILNFLLLNFALIVSFSENRNKENISQLLSIGSLVISSIYFCAYLFHYNSLITASILTPMALNSCICFILLGVGCLFTYPDKGYMLPIMSKKLGGRMARKILPLLIIIPLFTGAILLLGQHLDLYNAELGVAIHVVIVALLSFSLSYYFAKKLNEIDSIHKSHEHQLIKQSNLLHQSEFLLQETENIAKVGGWEITLGDSKVSYTKQIFLISGIEEPQIGFDHVLNSFTPESGKVINESLDLAIKEGKPYDVEAKLITANNKEIWVRVKGHAVLDNDGKVIAIRGTIQDINESKNKEILLQESNKIIIEQNARLMNFTHIVSHNLRTHASNIKSTLSIYDAEEDAEEKALILEMANQAADNLNQTIADLNDIVAVQSASSNLKSTLYFEDVFLNASHVLEREIKASQAIIHTDFSQCEKMDYVPAYLESIFHNFLSNAIKYRRPGIRPEIKITTGIENGDIAMTFSDNGLGIDLAKHKEKLFGMYKTFHNHPDSTGVGLFLTKYQVESLGGNIMVESAVNVGTTFKVLF